MNGANMKRNVLSEAAGGAGYGAEHEVPCAGGALEADRAYGAV